MFQRLRVDRIPRRVRQVVISRIFGRRGKIHSRVSFFAQQRTFAGFQFDQIRVRRIEHLNFRFGIKAVRQAGRTDRIGCIPVLGKRHRREILVAQCYGTVLFREIDCRVGSLFDFLFVYQLRRHQHGIAIAPNVQRKLLIGRQRILGYLFRFRSDPELQAVPFVIERKVPEPAHGISARQPDNLRIGHLAGFQVGCGKIVEIVQRMFHRVGRHQKSALLPGTVQHQRRRDCTKLARPKFTLKDASLRIDGVDIDRLERIGLTGIKHRPPVLGHREIFHTVHDRTVARADIDDNQPIVFARGFISFGSTILNGRIFNRSHLIGIGIERPLRRRFQFFGARQFDHLHLGKIHHGKGVFGHLIRLYLVDFGLAYLGKRYGDLEGSPRIVVKPCRAAAAFDTRRLFGSRIVKLE